MGKVYTNGNKRDLKWQWGWSVLRLLMLTFFV